MTEWNRVDEWAGIQIPSGIEAAFCPGAGPADNSCSPNEGGGGDDHNDWHPESFVEMTHGYHVEGLPKSQSDALTAYRGHGHLDINASLREGLSLKEHELPWGGKLGHTVSALDAAINSAPPLNKDAIVYRGIRGQVSAKPGDIIRDRAFMSTSFSKAQAKPFAKTDHEYIIDKNRTFFKIFVPKGASALGGFSASERELLLPRNSKLKVLKSKTIGNTTIVHALLQLKKALNLSLSPGDVYADFEFPLNLAFCPGAGPADNSCSPTGGVHGESGPGPMDTGGGRGGESSVSRSTGRAAAAASPMRRQEVFKELEDKHSEYVYDLGEWHPGVEALDEYVGSGHGQMNELLRFGKTRFSYNNSEAYFKTQIENLDQLIENAPLIPKDIVVTRGAGTSANKDWKVGEIIEDRGFMSTSFSPSKATAFSRGNHETPGALLKILVPKGMKGLVPPGTGEDELILQRGTRLKIIGVKEKQGKMGYFGRKVYKVFYAIARRGVRRAF